MTAAAFDVAFWDQIVQADQFCFLVLLLANSRFASRNIFVFFRRTHFGLLLPPFMPAHLNPRNSEIRQPAAAVDSQSFIHRNNFEICETATQWIGLFVLDLGTTGGSIRCRHGLISGPIFEDAVRGWRGKCQGASRPASDYVKFARKRG